MKKWISILLAILMLVTTAALFSCAKEDAEQGGEQDVVQPAEKLDLRVYALKGPTGMGMAKLMAENEAGNAAHNYTFTIAASPDEVTAEIIKGNYDIAALPTNLAAVLYKKTSGAIRVAAVNTLGVLYIVENGDTIQSIGDLNGKTIYATGQASTPEYVLNYILEANKIDCEVTYFTEHSELATQMVSGDVTLGMLPVPNATTVLAQTQCRAALNLTEEWEKAAQLKGDSGALYQGCIIVNPKLIEENPDAVSDFLAEYKASVDYINGNPDDASVIIETYGIIPKAAIAKKAIPNANIVCITGDEMAEGLMGFYKVLFNFNPASVGGSLPGEDIFYK